MNDVLFQLFQLSRLSFKYFRFALRKEKGKMEKWEQKEWCLVGEMGYGAAVM